MLILDSRELLLVFTIVILPVLIEFLECLDNHIFLIGVVIESIELELDIRLICSGSVELVQTITTAFIFIAKVQIFESLEEYRYES